MSRTAPRPMRRVDTEPVVEAETAIQSETKVRRRMHLPNIGEAGAMPMTDMLSVGAFFAKYGPITAIAIILFTSFMMDKYNTQQVQIALINQLVDNSRAQGASIQQLSETSSRIATSYDKMSDQMVRISDGVNRMADKIDSIDRRMLAGGK